MRKRKTIKFELNKETKLPKVVIEAIPQSGAADDAVRDLRREYNFECSLQDSIEFLKRYGAWNNEELQDLDDNIDRIIWLACLDCRENNTTWFYMGV